MQIALILAYPLLVHFAVITDKPSLQAAALVFLTLGILYQGLKKRLWLAWLLLIVISLLIALLTVFEFALYVIYLPPIIIPLLFWGVFAQTLLPGKVPLVTDIGEKARGPLTTEMRRYTHRVTLFWTIMLLSMSLWSIALVWIDSPLLWSLFTNLLNYLFVALVFVGEFYYRRWRFKDHDHPTLVDYLKIVFSSENFKRDHV